MHISQRMNLIFAHQYGVVISMTIAPLSGMDFVVDRDEFPTSESQESREWWIKEYGSGFMIHQNDGTDIFLNKADKDLLFISRAGSLA